MTTMKKTYIAPSVEVIKIGAISMLAASMEIKDGSVDTSGSDVQLGREDEQRPGTPNLWEQVW